MTEPEHPVSAAVSADDLREAVSSLTDLELAKLRYRAKFWAGSLGRYAMGRDWEDLLNEALVQMLNGQRSWNPEVGIVRFIDQAMRSIRWSWLAKGERSGVTGVVRVASTDSAQDSDEVALPEASSSPEALAADREILDKIEALFAEDSDASNVLTGYALGMKGPELREQAGLSEKEFEAARRRIRRRLLKEGLTSG